MGHIHFIGNAHIDPVWLWRWQDGYSEVLASWRSALDRMKEFDDFTFTAACAAYYHWVEQTDPDMFLEIQQRVAEGRWNVVGGWAIQPDCNLPCGEAFARQALISQRYFQKVFGKPARCGYNVDSFGHNASLPKILRNCGMDRYVFMRPDPNEKELPDLFQWTSDDQSSVVTYRIPTHYNVTEDKQEQIDGLTESVRKDGLPRMLFVGIGNHGGGPSSNLIRHLKSLDLPQSFFSTADRYFDEVQGLELPEIKEELQHHARGCYSVMSRVKAQNRKCEANLLAAERFCLLANRLVGSTYPQEELLRGWKNLLFNQFHDILAGCAIESVFTDADYLFGETMSITEREINKALQGICRKINTGAASDTAFKVRHEGRLVWHHEILGTPIVVFNPHPFAVEDAVILRVNAARMTDENGKEVPFQYVRGEQTNGEGDMNVISLKVQIPPLGYRVYRAFGRGERTETFPSVQVTETSLENDFLRVDFDRTTGEISCITDKKNGKVLANGGFSTVLTDETNCDTWAHNQFDLGEACGTFGNPKFTVLEQGCVRGALQVQTSFGRSVLTREYRLYAHGDEIKVKVCVDYHEHHKALKFCFPAKEKVLCEIPFGTITRNLKNGEDPFGKWFASAGIAVANDGKYGYDSTDDQIRMTVLRGAIFADHYGVRDDRCRFTDQGESRFTYTVFPFRSVGDAQRRAEILNLPLRAVTDTFHFGPLPQISENFSNPSENVIVTALKKAEDSDGIVLRCYEVEGKETNTQIQTFGQSISVHLAPHAVGTVDGEGKKLNFMEWEDVL